MLGCTYKTFELAGNVDYTRKEKSAQETLKHAVELKYRQNIHETKDKKYLVYLGGKVYLDHDVFNNTCRVNTMSSVGIEF
jgi:hypothetical protein